LTVAGVEKLTEYAHQGLPIVISGGTPFNLSGYNASGSAYVKAALADLTELENVHEVPTDNLSASLTSLGLAPRTKVDADRIWYTYWREDEKAAKTYVFVYNDAWDSELGLGSSNGSVTFETTGVPYFYDAWTGEIEAVRDYQQTEKSTVIPLSLAGNQSAIVGFHHDEAASNPDHAGNLPNRHDSASKPSQTNHKYSSIQPSQHPFNKTLPLTPWTLTIESWHAPEDLTADQTLAAKTNSTPYHLPTLQPWTSISASLTNTSGRGFYNTTFTWPPSDCSPNDRSSSRHALLDLGALSNTARAWVNNHQLPPLDPTHAVADISKYLQEGENEVRVVVATTLGNAVRPLWGGLRSSGTLALGPLPVVQEYGLVGKVNLMYV
jgi:hypothetical protein